MDFLKKLFNIPIKEDKQIQNQEVNLSLDDLFVHNFVNKGGKFLYCTSEADVKTNFANILSENNWNAVQLLNPKLKSIVNQKEVRIATNTNSDLPAFTTCEHLIADNGDVLFSSKQLKSTKLKDYTNNFIVYATTSQLVKDTGQGLTGIKTKYANNLPTNISSIKNYSTQNVDDNFLNYGNNNSKNLYLLLFEDL
ncbi:hypothetical protein [Polaribacter sp. P097]|uniref:hypothetical protein n=1 Tax=Polaribacter sp. P097 TaxID=3117398 RepID=UPI002FDFE025